MRTYAMMPNWLFVVCADIVCHTINACAAAVMIGAFAHWIASKRLNRTSSNSYKMMNNSIWIFWISNASHNWMMMTQTWNQAILIKVQSNFQRKHEMHSLHTNFCMAIANYRLFCFQLDCLLFDDTQSSDECIPADDALLPSNALIGKTHFSNYFSALIDRCLQVR